MNTLRASLLSGATTNRPLLHNYSQQQSRDKIPDRVIEAVTDKSYPQFKKKNMVDYFVIWSEFIRQEPVEPQNTKLLIWHGIILFIILFYIFEVGLLMGYGIAVWNDELNYLFAVNIIFIILLLIDCVVTSFKSFYKHGLLITNRRLIVKRYLIPWFWLDLICIASICLPVFTQDFALNWIKIIFLIKLRTAYLIDKEFTRVTQLRINVHTFYLLSRLIIFLILGSHYLGIWFYMIDYWVYETNYYGPNTPNICWLYNAQAFSQMVLLLPWYGQYEYTMYFSIGTMTTIAYGDITPLNPIQTIYVTVALLFYTIGFGYILSEVLRILMEAQAAKFEHSNNLLIVSNLMKNSMIKKNTQEKVKSYFERVWKEEIYRNRDIEKELMDSLPLKIKNQLLFKLYEEFYRTVGFIYGPSSTFLTQFMMALADSTKEQRLIEQRYLYKENEEFQSTISNSHCLFFIKRLLKGRIKPSVELGISGIVLTTLSEGEFGTEGFLTGEVQNHWARAITSVLVYYIPRNALLQKISTATMQERQNLFLLTEKVSIKKCFICQEEDESKTHEFLNCPYVTYRPPILKLLNQEQKKLKERVQKHIFQRKQKAFTGKSNALVQFKNVSSTQYQVKNKYRLLLSNKYYGSLIKQKQEKQRPMVNKEELNIRQIESQDEEEEISSSETSSDTSSDSSQDLDHYLKQTEIFIQYLEENQEESAEHKHSRYCDIDLDVGKQFKIYKPQDNLTKVLKRFAEQKKINRERRRVQNLKIYF